MGTRINFSILKNKKTRLFFLLLSILLAYVLYAMINNIPFPFSHEAHSSTPISYSDLVLSSKDGTRGLLTMRDTLVIHTAGKAREFDMNDISFVAVEPSPDVEKAKAKIKDTIYVEIRTVDGETIKGETSRWLQEKGYIFKTQVDILAVDYIESNIYTSDKDIYIKVINRLPSIVEK